MVNELDKLMSKSIGRKIAQKRTELELSREKLAAMSDGVDANSIYRYEVGKRVPSFPTVIRLAKGLNTSLIELVPDEYIDKNDKDPKGVLELFYQMDDDDQKFMIKQMKAMIQMSKQQKRLN